MNMIVFMTAAGAPLAMLGLSTPVVPQRNCIFIVHPQITSAVFESKEGRIAFPDRPIEYPDRVPGRGVADGGSPRSPAGAGLVSWRLPGG